MSLLVSLSEAADDDGPALAYLGAGPVEDLLRHNAERFIDEVESAARSVPSFRRALQSAWFERFLSPDQATQLRRFGGGP